MIQDSIYTYHLPDGHFPSTGKPQPPGWYWQLNPVAWGGKGPFETEEAAREDARR